jgi:hypothetical protein
MQASRARNESGSGASEPVRVTSLSPRRPYGRSARAISPRRGRFVGVRAEGALAHDRVEDAIRKHRESFGVPQMKANAVRQTFAVGGFVRQGNVAGAAVDAGHLIPECARDVHRRGTSARRQVDYPAV